MPTDNDAPDAELAEAIRGLRDAPPERDLWPGIHRELVPHVRRGFVQVRWPFAIAAGLTLIAASVGGTVVWLQRGAAPSGSLAAGRSGDAVVVTAADRGTGHASLERAIADLETALQENVESFEPGTYHAVAKSLALLDRAIADAVARGLVTPGDPQVERYVAATLQRKLNVLRSVTQLTSERS